MGTNVSGKGGRRRRVLSPSQKYEVFLEVTTSDLTQAQVAVKWGIDRSTVKTIVRTAVARHDLWQGCCVSPEGESKSFRSPPSIPAEKKSRIVLSVLAGERTIAEAARREKVSEQSISRWKAEFGEAGKTALAAGRSGPSGREEQLEAEVVELTQALGEAGVEVRVPKKSAQCRLGPRRPRGDPHRGGNVDGEVLPSDRQDLNGRGDAGRPVPGPSAR